MFDRNENREILLNDHKLYNKLLKDRGLKSFRHLSRMRLNSMSPSDMKNITVVDYIYKTGDSLSKISFQYYGDTRFWWVLGWFNNKPIDNLFNVGDVVHVPFPIEEVMYYVSRDV